jgi:hypothetical protein
MQVVRWLLMLALLLVLVGLLAYDVRHVAPLLLSGPPKHGVVVERKDGEGVRFERTPWSTSDTNFLVGVAILHGVSLLAFSLTLRQILDASKRRRQ